MRLVQDVRELLPTVAAGAAIELRCPLASPCYDAEGIPSVSCGAIERANEAEGNDVSALVSGRTSGSTISLFCAGKGIPGVELDPARAKAIRGSMTPREAHESMSYTACPVFRDERDRLDRVRREGQSAKLRAADVVRSGQAAVAHG